MRPSAHLIANWMQLESLLTDVYLYQKTDSVQEALLQLRDLRQELLETHYNDDDVLNVVLAKLQMVHTNLQKLLQPTGVFGYTTTQRSVLENALTQFRLLETLFLVIVDDRQIRKWRQQ